MIINQTYCPMRSIYILINRANVSWAIIALYFVDSIFYSSFAITMSIISMISGLSLMGLSSATPIYKKRLKNTFLSSSAFIFVVQYTFGTLIAILLFKEFSLFDDYRFLILSILFPINQFLISMRLTSNKEFSKFFIFLHAAVLSLSLCLFIMGMNIFNVLLLNVCAALFINIIINFDKSYAAQKLFFNMITLIKFHISRIYGTIGSDLILSPLKPMILIYLLNFNNSSEYIFAFNIIILISSAVFQFNLRFIFNQFSKYEKNNLMKVIFDKSVLHIYVIGLTASMAFLIFMNFYKSLSETSFILILISASLLTLISKRIDVENYRANQTENTNYLSLYKALMIAVVMYPTMQFNYISTPSIILFFGFVQALFAFVIWNFREQLK